VEDPHRLAAPLDDHHVARGELVDVHLHRRAGGQGPLGRGEAGHEGHGGAHRERAARAGGGDQQQATGRVAGGVDAAAGGGGRGGHGRVLVERVGFVTHIQYSCPLLAAIKLMYIKVLERWGGR
jgi:hypothetical protein